MVVLRQRHPTHIRKIWGAVKTVSDFIPELTRALRFQFREEREKQVHHLTDDRKGDKERESQRQETRLNVQYF